MKEIRKAKSHEKYNKIKIIEGVVQDIFKTEDGFRYERERYFEGVKLDVEYPIYNGTKVFWMVQDALAGKHKVYGWKI